MIFFVKKNIVVVFTLGYLLFYQKWYFSGKCDTKNMLSEKQNRSTK